MHEDVVTLWKAVIALTLVDGKVTEEEKLWVKENLQSIAFTPEQRQILSQELENPGDFEKIAEKITKPAHKSLLIHLANQLFRTDTLDTEEESMYHKLNAKAMANVKMHAIRAKLKQVEQDVDRKWSKEIADQAAAECKSLGLLGFLNRIVR